MPCFDQAATAFDALQWCWGSIWRAWFDSQQLYVYVDSIQSAFNEQITHNAQKCAVIQIYWAAKHEKTTGQMTTPMGIYICTSCISHFYTTTTEEVYGNCIPCVLYYIPFVLSIQCKPAQTLYTIIVTQKGNSTEKLISQLMWNIYAVLGIVLTLAGLHTNKI